MTEEIEEDPQPQGRAGHGDREGKPLPLDQLEDHPGEPAVEKQDSRTIHFP